MFYTAKIQKIIESRKFLADLFGYIAFFYYLCTIFNTISAYKYKYIYKNISIRLIKKYNSWQSHIKYLHYCPIKKGNSIFETVEL